MVILEKQNYNQKTGVIRQNRDFEQIDFVESLPQSLLDI